MVAGMNLDDFVIPLAWLANIGVCVIAIGMLGIPVICFAVIDC